MGITPSRKKKTSTSHIIIIIGIMQLDQDLPKECEKSNGRELTKWSSSFTRIICKWKGALLMGPRSYYWQNNDGKFLSIKQAVSSIDHTIICLQ